MANNARTIPPVILKSIMPLLEIVLAESGRPELPLRALLFIDKDRNRFATPLTSSSAIVGMALDGSTTSSAP